MQEREGPTTQLDVLYQSSVASLYLGCLGDATARPPPPLTPQRNRLLLIAEPHKAGQAYLHRELSYHAYKGFSQ